MRPRIFAIVLLLLVLGAVPLCVVVLDEREQAFRTLFDNPEPHLFGMAMNRPVLDKPGWYLRIPGVHSVYRYDRRLLRFEGKPRELYTSEKELLEVDYYAIWKIANPRKFFESVRTLRKANTRIDEVTYREVRNTLGLHKLEDLLSTRRREIVQQISEASQGALAPLGIQLVDLEIRRTDYPDANLARILDRMRSERQREAKRFRAEGEQKARTIRSQADLESQTIGARARKEATRLKGEGDARAAAIYAESYQKDPEFYQFVRSLRAYEKSIDQDTTLILSPQLPFFRYFFSPWKDATP